MHIPIPAYNLAMEKISTIQFLKIEETPQNEKSDHFPKKMNNIGQMGGCQWFQ